MPSIVKAVYTGDQKKFTECISKKKLDLSPADKLYERNVFHWIAVTGKSNFAQQIIQIGKNDFSKELNAQDREGRSAICLVTYDK
jgi:hypothetical protein